MSGIFDGNNHTIVFGINGTNESTSEIGMFRTFSGIIMNLNINNSSITGVSTMEGKESKYNEPATGALVGYMESGIIKNVNINARVSSGQLQNVGGFVGHTNGKVEFRNCTYNGQVSGSYNVGGFVGCAKGRIIMDNCTKNGEVLMSTYYNAGGLIGVAENDVTIENCEANGTISSSGVNIGGLIGYTSAGNNVVIKKCTNKAPIRGTHNVGGIIGYNESIINIFECNNEGTISCNNVNNVGGDNAGGIVGYSKVSGDAPANAIVGFDSNTKTITLNIKNKETEETYKININKVDLSLEQGNKGLSGAKFNIYDKDKNLIKENSSVNENGYLTIDNVTINSLVTDVYFIKEVEAPAGYDILIKDYIKIEVTKTWDGVNEKYIIHTNSSVVAEPNETETEEDHTKTGNTVEKLTYTNVRYKTNKTAIQNCTNIGNVSAASNSGGIAGSIRGYCLVDGCNNESEFVVSSGNVPISGGIVGDIAVNTKNDEAKVLNCKNRSAVRGAHVGGIVGITGSTIEITDCENSGAVTPSTASTSNSGGIVGSIFKIATIDNCTNNGQVVGYHSGGIVGSAIGATNAYAKNIVGFNINCEYLEITNCNVSTSQIIAQGGNASGIIAAMCADECSIKNNVVENITVSLSQNQGNSIAGIVASTHGASIIEIEDCDVISATIAGGNLGTAGIMGSFGGNSIHDGVELSGSYDSEIRINNCNIYGGRIISNRLNASGILSSVGESGFNGEYNQSILITNCGVYSDDKGNSCQINGKDQVTGIVGGNSISSKANVNLTVEKSIVENAELICSKDSNNSGGGSNLGGIAGYYNGGNYNIAIRNSKIINSTMTNLWNSYSCNNTAGICVGMYAESKNNITITIDGCETDNINIRSIRGGNISGVISDATETKKLEVNDCKVNNLSVEIQEEDKRYASNNGFGGIIAMSRKNNDAIINNCSVKGININNAKTNVGGLVGYVEGKYDDTNKFEITNCECVGYMDEKTNKLKSNTFVAGSQLVTCGGIIGFATNGVSMNLENLECSDIIMKAKVPLISYGGDSGSGSYQLGGFAGEMLGCKDISISNVNVSNIEIDNDYAVEVAGFIGLMNTYSRSTDFVLKDVNVSNVNIKGTFGTASAFIAQYQNNGYSYDKEVRNNIIDNVQVSDYNIIIDNPRIIPSSEGYYVSGFISKLTNLKDKISITNININNGNIELKNIGDELFKYDKYRPKDAGAIAGLIAMVDSGININISDVELNDFSAKVEFTNKERNNGKEIMHIAGIIGTNHNTSTTKTNIENISISNLNMNNESKDGMIGGLIGTVYERKEGEVTIENSTVNNITANGKYGIGGIIGCGKSTIENCTVTNPILTGTSQTATVGGAIGIAMEESNATNITVTADLPEGSAEPDTYGIFSDYMAGGIAAINSGTLSDSKVENVIVKTFMKLIQESENSIAEPETANTDNAQSTDNTDNIQNTEDPESNQTKNELNNEQNNAEEDVQSGSVAVENATNTPCADEIQVQYLERWTNCIVNNVKLIQERISL